jgi:hypothetical protein
MHEELLPGSVAPAYQEFSRLAHRLYRSSMMLPQAYVQVKRAISLRHSSIGRDPEPLAGHAAYTYDARGALQAKCAAGAEMSQLINVNPTCEHALYLRLFVTNAGGW